MLIGCLNNGLFSLNVALNESEQRYLYNFVPYTRYLSYSYLNYCFAIYLAGDASAAAEPAAKAEPAAPPPQAAAAPPPPAPEPAVSAGPIPTTPPPVAPTPTAPMTSTPGQYDLCNVLVTKQGTNDILGIIVRCTISA